MINTLYYLAKISVNFWCKRGSKPKLLFDYNKFYYELTGNDVRLFNLPDTLFYEIQMDSFFY